VGRREEDGVLETLGEGEGLLGEFAEHQTVLPPCPIRDLQAIQHPEQLRRVPQGLTQHACPGQERCSLREALRVHQHHPEVEQHVHFLPDPLARVRERLQHVYPLAEVHDGFALSHALPRPLAGPLPVRHRLLGESRLGIVMRQQFGLGLSGLGEMRH
jgi:hypothetical protein